MLIYVSYIMDILWSSSVLIGVWCCFLILFLFMYNLCFDVPFNHSVMVCCSIFTEPLNGTTTQRLHIARKNTMKATPKSLQHGQKLVIIKSYEFHLGTIHILCKHWAGWIGSENGNFWLLSVNNLCLHNGWLGQ